MDPSAPEPEAQHLMVTAPKVLGVEARVVHVRAAFDDDHVHMVLVVDRAGRLVTALERDDLTPASDDAAPASRHGRLAGRTVPPTTPESAVARILARTGRRRLAVVDDHGRLLGLVCRKRSGTGYCHDDDVRARAAERHGGRGVSTAGPAG